MKRIIYLIAAICLVVNSCTIETSDNGDFDGFWHLERVDTLATGNYLDLSRNVYSGEFSISWYLVPVLPPRICTASVAIISDSNRRVTVWSCIRLTRTTGIRIMEKMVVIFLQPLWMTASEAMVSIICEKLFTKRSSRAIKWCSALRCWGYTSLNSKKQFVIQNTFHTH